MDVDAKSPEFLSKILKKNVVSVESQVLTEEEGGMSGAVLTRLVLKMDKGEEFSLILKERRDNLESSIQLGLAREAFVMPYLKKAFEGHIPKIYHAFGSMKTGEKVRTFRKSWKMSFFPTLLSLTDSLSFCRSF